MALQTFQLSNNMRLLSVSWEKQVCNFFVVEKMFPISFGKNARSKKTEEADFMLQLSHAK